MTSRMSIRDIKESQWWPANDPLQVYPERGPQVARIRMGCFTLEDLAVKVEELKTKLSLEPQGCDGVFYYFTKSEDRPRILQPGQRFPGLN